MKLDADRWCGWPKFSAIAVRMKICVLFVTLTFPLHLYPLFIFVTDIGYTSSVPWHKREVMVCFSPMSMGSDGVFFSDVYDFCGSKGDHPIICKCHNWSYVSQKFRPEWSWRMFDNICEDVGTTTFTITSFTCLWRIVFLLMHFCGWVKIT